MKFKDIKLIIKKQLKNKFPNWKRLKKKEKKKAAKKISEAVIQEYDSKKVIEAPIEELISIDNQTPERGILTIDQMNTKIEDFQKNSVIKINKLKTNIENDKLRFIDNLLDDYIINDLLSYKGFNPHMREYLPSNFLRAELLKSLMYPEISYRKFCSDEYLGINRKQNREFIGLRLNTKKYFDHTQLSKFRSSLKFVQATNLLVYILRYFFESGILSKDNVIHGADSTELPNDNKIPLFSKKVGDKKIKVYTDLDSDCGQRRNKRNKSKYFVGYRMHTLTAIDTKTNQSFPLLSLISAANHHDSLFLKPLISLAQAIGIDLKLITADEAYHDSDNSIYEDTGVRLITPSSINVKLPANVEADTLAVTCNDSCEIPMKHLGSFEEGHEFKCTAKEGECIHKNDCTQCRIIPFDNGYYQRVMPVGKHAEEALDIRKNIERPFNLLKFREGLENIRVRSQKSFIALSVFATMTNLLIELEKRSAKTDIGENKQINLFDFIKEKEEIGINLESSNSNVQLKVFDNAA
ncbi:MAG: transposase [Cryomorphaceae bacterium]|jgi:hypothetical protein|nr:transposase [Cryomorphaceae bacterium]